MSSMRLRDILSVIWANFFVTNFFVTDCALFFRRTNLSYQLHFVQVLLWAFLASKYQALPLAVFKGKNALLQKSYYVKVFFKEIISINALFLMYQTLPWSSRRAPGVMFNLQFISIEAATRSNLVSGNSNNRKTLEKRKF